MGSCLTKANFASIAIFSALIVKRSFSPYKSLYHSSYIFQQQRGSIQQDELSPQEKQAIQGEEQQQKITSYEEAFRRIKEATGVSDTMVLELDYEDIFDLMYKLILFDLYVS
jgi:hypothetical protein